MAFTPHTQADIDAMLSELGVDSIDALFDEIPDSLKIKGLDLPAGDTEMHIAKHLEARATQDKNNLCFIGAGAYEHYIPAAVWQIATRGEFMTAYTPYQAEASQGALQTFYEYQSMMAHLMAMDVSNASLYDGASSLGEAVLMAVRCHPSSQNRRVLVPKTVHPNYRRTTTTLVAPQNIPLEVIPYDSKGHTDITAVQQWANKDIAAVVIPQPNFFGQFEDVDGLTDWAHQQGAIVIGVVNPIAMSWIKPPGEWGEHGADIVCGEGQPLGTPLAYGGPYFGFMCCRKKYLRHMPGRLIGRTVDKNGHTGYTMTLQPREQHIRRAKATSNICTNQGLMVIAATIYMSLMGSEGLKRVAQYSHLNTQSLRDKLTAIPGVAPMFESPFFHECVIQLPQDAKTILNQLAQKGIDGGYALKPEYPELGNSVLICATETKTQAELDHYSETLKAIIEATSNVNI